MTDSAESRERHPGPAPRSGSALPWGTAYRGRGSHDAAVRAVLETLDELGLEAQVVREHDGLTRIDAVQRSPWYRLLTGGLPQRAVALVEGTGGEDGSRDGPLRLEVDLTMEPWYRRLIVGFWITWVVALAALFWFTEPGGVGTGSGGSVLLLAGVLVFLLAIGAVPWLLGAVGGGRMSAVLWQPLLDRVEREGGFLEPSGTGISRRYGAWMLAYLLSFLLCGGGALVVYGLGTLWRATPLGFWVLAALTGLAVLLFVLAAVLYVRRGLALRLDPLMPALMSTVTMMIFLGLPFPLALIGGVVEQTLTGRVDVEMLGRQARMIMLAVGTFGAVGLASGIFGLTTAPRAWLSVERTGQQRGRPGVYREAVAGGTNLALARGFFLTFGAVVAALILTGLACAAAWAVHAVIPVWERPLLRLPEASGALLALALGRPPGDPWALVAARTAWVVWAGVGWAALGISVGQLGRERRRERKRLRERARGAPPELLRRVRGLLEELIDPEQVRSAGVVISPGGGLGASAYRFGGPSGERFVEVSEGALRRLSDPELQALLAHELVHLQRGHALRHAMARWLGRIGFFGDGFSRALLDSFGSEAEADREAVRSFGANPEALIRCLQKIKVLNSLKRRPSNQGEEASSGIRLVGRSPQLRSMFETDAREAILAAENLPLPQRWAAAWRLFVDQYFHLSELLYWHPVSDERIERLRRLAAEAAPRPGGGSGTDERKAEPDAR